MPSAVADGDPRIAVARTEMDALYDTSPEFKAIHYESAEGPTECVTVLAGDVRSMQYETLANVPSYGAWSDRCDHATAYAHHRRTLQVLQSEDRGRWVLKSPVHNLALDDLLGTYPDAVLVVTHRDPARVVVSLANLVRVLGGLGSDADWTRYLGRRWLQLVSLMLDRQADVRDRLGESARDAGRWIDIDYQALAADPVGTVTSLYERLGWPGDRPGPRRVPGPTRRPTRSTCTGPPPTGPPISAWRWTPRPVRSSSSEITSGGATWMRLKWTKGHSPRPCTRCQHLVHRRASAPAALKGTSGSRVARSRTSSMAKKQPRPRTSPTTGCRSAMLAQRGADHVRRRGGRACSTMPSSSKMRMDATAAAQASGCPQ